MTEWGSGGTGEASELSRGLMTQRLECQAADPKEQEEAYRALSSSSLRGGPCALCDTHTPAAAHQGNSISQLWSGRGSWRPSLCASKCHPQWVGHPILGV